MTRLFSLIASFCAIGLAGLLVAVAAEPSPVGTWDIRGKDTAGVTWNAVMVLVGDKGALSGHIDWVGSDGTVGREIVSAAFDPATRLLKVNGQRVERSNGVVTGKYSAELSPDGSRLDKGRWTGDSAPGGWSASRSAGSKGTGDIGGTPRKKADPAADKTGFLHRRFTLENGTVSHYVVFVPHAYDGTKDYPVILFLHGSGETKGEGGRPVAVGLGPHIRRNEENWPFITLFPQAEELGWRPRNVNGELALGILDKTLREFKTDAKRVYLTGLSMGGMGTWNFAVGEPRRWAAIVPVCGSGNPDKVERLKEIPCWAFHGSADPNVPVDGSRRMIAALRRSGAAPKYTEYPGVKHNCWDQAYSTPELWTWLARQQQK